MWNDNRVSSSGRAVRLPADPGLSAGDGVLRSVQSSHRRNQNRSRRRTNDHWRFVASWLSSAVTFFTARRCFNVVRMLWPCDGCRCLCSVLCRSDWAGFGTEATLGLSYIDVLREFRYPSLTSTVGSVVSFVHSTAIAILSQWASSFVCSTIREMQVVARCLCNSCDLWQ